MIRDRARKTIVFDEKYRSRATSCVTSYKGMRKYWRWVSWADASAVRCAVESAEAMHQAPSCCACRSAVPMARTG